MPLQKSKMAVIPYPWDESENDDDARPDDKSKIYQMMMGDKDAARVARKKKQQYLSRSTVVET
jgi:hypothetical protein